MNSIHESCTDTHALESEWRFRIFQIHASLDFHFTRPRPACQCTHTQSLAFVNASTVWRLSIQLETQHTDTHTRRRARQPTTLLPAVASMASPASFTATPLWKTILVVITICATQVFADSWYALCYFPNGDISPHDTPCSDDGGACCPKDWECLSNGMCIRHIVFHERHSCTDQRWLVRRKMSADVRHW